MIHRYLPPLHVHLLCLAAPQHPARIAVDTLDHLLQGDPLLHATTALDIPAFLVPVDAAGPGQIPWGVARCHAIVVFVDDTMYRDGAIWGPWLDVLVAAADAHGGVVLAITSEAGIVGNLSPVLAQKQVIRVPAKAPAGVDAGDAWATEVTLRVFRALATRLAAPGEGLGCLFLSHAKSDGLWLAAAIRDELARFATGA